MTNATRHETFELDHFENSVNAAAGRVRGLWLGYIVLVAYLIITVGSVTHRDLFLENPVRLPVLNVDLSLQGFFFFAPIFFLINHFYLLLHLVGLRWRIREYDEAVDGAIQYGKLKRADEDTRRRGLDSFVIVRAFGGTREERWGGTSWFFKLIIWITMIAAPIFVLLQMQWAFIAYHDELVTWVHRLAVTLDLVLLWLFWPMVHSGHPRLKLALPFSGVAASVVGLVFLFFSGVSWLVLTFPGEVIDRVAVAWISEEQKQEWMAKPFRKEWDTPKDPLLWTVKQYFPRNLQLSGEFLIDRDLHHKIVKRKPKGEKPHAGERTLVVSTLAGKKVRNLILANLTDADLRAVDFSGASLQGASLDGASLQGASLDGASLQSASLFGTDLQGASLGFANLQGASLDGASLQGASLGFASLQGALLDRASLQGALLDRASLQGASLDGASLQGASLFGASLQGASLFGASLQGALLDGASLQGALLVRASLQGASLDGASLQGASLVRASLQGASLIWARLQGASLVRASLQGASLDRASLQGASLVRASLQGASLDGASLQSASLIWARLHGASLDGLYLRQAELNNTRLWRSYGDANFEDPLLLHVSFDALSEAKFEELLRDATEGVESEKVKAKIRERLSRLTPNPRPDDPHQLNLPLTEVGSLPPAIVVADTGLQQVLREIGCEGDGKPNVVQNLSYRLAGWGRSYTGTVFRDSVAAPLAATFLAVAENPKGEAAKDCPGAVGISDEAIEILQKVLRRAEERKKRLQAVADIY